MIRTFCLVSHNNLFTMASSRLGGDILATNAILFQIMSIFSYAFDGIANTVVYSLEELEDGKIIHL